jgi:GH25 family lysozyme M1 (1,4-beta-N-acetylmuramidase)
MIMELSDLHGIDISSWQRGLSPSSLNSVDFAILKLSEGTSWNDPCFDEFYSAATIPLGAYVYSHATTEGEAQAEAIHALSLLQGRKLPLGIYMDVEEQKQLALSDSHLTAVVKAFCDAIKRGGYRAGAYGSAGNLWAKVGPSYLGDDVIVWVAQWGSRPRMGDVWQFSASDHVDGFNGNVDGNKVLSERFGQMVVSQEPVNNGSSTQPVEPPKENACEVALTLPIVKFGDRGLHVKLMQTALIAKGYNCGWMGADGDFGQQTKIALFQFQKKMGLETDCVCGAATWKALLNS